MGEIYLVTIKPTNHSSIIPVSDKTRLRVIISIRFYVDCEVIEGLPLPNWVLDFNFVYWFVLKDGAPVLKMLWGAEESSLCISR